MQNEPTQNESIQPLALTQPLPEQKPLEVRIVEIETTDEFDRRSKALTKKYRNLKLDLEPLTLALQSGETPGDTLTGLEILAFKVRLTNSNLSRGKSGGYRVIYYVVLPTKIVLLTIYTKSEQENISAKEIERIVAAFNRRNDQTEES
jgi:mRNA-degrading endonuclease RelE of RelBE toxin-antitoxin system